MSNENTRPLKNDFATTGEIREFLIAPIVENKEKNKVYELTALILMLGIIIASLADK